VIDTQLQNAEHEKTVDIYNYVSKLREQRNFMVQTEDQYVFVHDAVLESLVSGKTEVSSQNLRRYIANLETKDPDTDQNGFEKQFKLLANSKERANQFHYKQANLDANKKKNRMVNILPYDSSRVCLEISPGVEGSDYINASFIDGYYTRRAFIATQGPIQETVPDFWHMLWKTNSNTVVMLTKLVEKGQERCAQYWPTTQAGRFGALLVTLEKETPGKVYTTREFTVMNTKESVSRTVTQFHYMTWPESGVPDSGAALLDLIGQVQRTQQQTGNGPVTVHDSTGVGRTGAFITLSVCIERLKAENTVDVFQTVKLLRTQRPFMVQTTGQLTFCYKTIIEYLDSFDTYSNFK
jgi:protein tyrosine phosphatase